VGAALAAPAPSFAPEARPAAPTPPASAPPDGALAEWREARAQLEDVGAFKTRLDALSLRVSSQDSALKALERSSAALRQEYTTISQATDAQSVVRLEAAERALARLEAAFQDFSTRLERRTEELERAAPPDGTAYEATALEAQDDLRPLDRVALFLPFATESDGAVTLERRGLDGAGRPWRRRLVVQSGAGEPLVCF